jgi:tetratricopeptide (TPR) repeat protein
MTRRLIEIFVNFNFKYLIAVVFVFNAFAGKAFNNKYLKTDSLTNTEILLIYEKSSDAIENFLFYLNAYKEEEISNEEAVKITEEILLRFTEKANIYSDLNAENIDFASSPTTSVNVADYLTQFRGQPEIKGVLSDRQELGYEVTMPVFNGKTYELRVSYNKEIKGADRKGATYQRTKQLATLVVEKTNGQFKALIQEISFLKPNQDYGFLPESASKAIRDAAFARLQMKQSGNDNFGELDMDALNSVLKNIANELGQNQKLYSNYLSNTRKFIAQLDFANASRELEKAKKIQSQGAEYKSLKIELEEKAEQRAIKLLGWAKDALNRMEYERINDFVTELRTLSVDENLVTPLLSAANAGAQKWNVLTTGKSGNAGVDERISTLNQQILSGKFANNNDSLAESHAALAFLVLKKGDKNSKSLATQHLTTAINSKKNYSRARIMLLDVDYTPEKAIQTYTELIAIDADNELYYIERAKIYAEQKNYKPAAADYEKALSLRPLNINARKNLARMYLQIPEMAPALKQYRILESIKKEPINSIYKTYAFLELNYPDSALAEKKNYQASSSAVLDSIVDNYYQNALRLMGYSAYAEAASIFDKIYVLVGHQNDHADYWHTAAECHYYLKNNAKAQHFLLISIGILPSHFEANKLNGEIYLASKDYKNAKETFEKCLEIRKGDYKVTKLLADTYYFEGKYYFEASNYYTKALQMAELDKNLKGEVYALKIQLARCALMIDQLDEAIKHCEEAIKLNDKKPDAYFEQGVALGRKSDETQVKKGLKQLEKALELLYDQAKCFKASAEIQLRLKNYSAALAEYQKLERTANYIFKADDFVLSAKINEGLGKPTEALSDLYKALKEDSTLSKDDIFLMQLSMVRIKHGVLSNTKKDIEDSKITIESVLRNNREEPRIYLIYSVYHYYTDNISEAVEMLKTALKYNLNVSAAEKDPFIKDYFKDVPQIKQTLKQK